MFEVLTYLGAVQSVPHSVLVHFCPSERNPMYLVNPQHQLHSYLEPEATLFVFVWICLFGISCRNAASFL